MVISYSQQILFCQDFVFCKEIFCREKNNQHDERDAKNGELGEPFRAIFPPICANYWSKSRIYADFRIFCSNLSEAESTFVVIQTFLAGLLGADNNSNIRRSVQRSY